MFTKYYNGLYINGSTNESWCYITGADCFRGLRFKSYRAAQLAITKARKEGVPATR